MSEQDSTASDRIEQEVEAAVYPRGGYSARLAPTTPAGFYSTYRAVREAL